MQMKIACIANMIWSEGDRNYHYIDGLLVGKVDHSYKAEPENNEPDKCDGKITYQICLINLMMRIFMRHVCFDHFFNQ